MADPLEALNEAWIAQVDAQVPDLVMRFADEGLVLGAGTVLAKGDGKGGEISIDPDDPRLRALLTAAHMRRPTDRAIAYLRKAAQRWSEGQPALATMHLALSGVNKLRRPAPDAHRMFMADRLLKAGVDAVAVIRAIEAGARELDQFYKYDPDQPRIPAGSGPTSGEWTSGDGGSSTLNPTQPEVNPSTITQVANTGMPDACTRAHIDCVDAAVAADARSPDAGGAANDNTPLKIDLENCGQAYAACDLLSWITEDLPLPLRGGVIFPHRGVVYIEKGAPDIYIPPLPGFRFPRIRRLLGPAGEGSKGDVFSYPPWSATPDESA